MFFCFLCTSTGQVRYVRIPVPPVNPLATEVLMCNITVIHDVGGQGSWFFMFVCVAAHSFKGRIDARSVHCRTDKERN